MDTELEEEQEEEEPAEGAEEEEEQQEGEETEEEEAGTSGEGRSTLHCQGLGPPLLGLRNRPAYHCLRDKPDNLTGQLERAAHADAINFQRWKPSLMIPATLLKDVLLHDHYTPLKARRADAIGRQGNALAVVPLRPGAAEKTLLVHAAGEMLDSVYLSFLHHPNLEDGAPQEGDGLSASRHDHEGGHSGSSSSPDWRCSMSMSRSRGVCLGMGSIQQISRVFTESQDEDDRGGCPLMFMTRAGYEAQLFTIDSFRSCQGAVHSVKAEYRLKFPTLLSDIACRSSQRIALITEKNEMYEWSSVRGAVRCSQGFVVGDEETDGRRPLLAWGCHPRTLWAASGGRLHLVDLRRGRPVKLYCLQHTDMVSLQEHSPNTGTILSLCCHPTNSQQLFVSADDTLRLMDVRYTRQAVSSRRQSETCSLLSTVSLKLPWADMEAPPDTVVVGAGRNLGRIHLHHWSGREWSPSDISTSLPPLKGIVRSWFGGCQAMETTSSLDHAFFNCDIFPERNYASHIAGLGLITPPSSRFPFQRVCLPFMNSMGDIYVQQACLCSSDSTDAPRGRVHGAELPVGVGSHRIQDDCTTKAPRVAPRPSVSIPTDCDSQDLRPHKALSMDCPPYGPYRALLEPTREVAAIMDEFRVYSGLMDWLSPRARSLFEVYCHLASLAPEVRAFNYKEVHQALSQESAIQGFRCNTYQEVATRRQEVLHKRPWIHDHRKRVQEKSCDCRMEVPNEPPCDKPDCLGVDWWIYSVVGRHTPTRVQSLEATSGRKGWSGLSQEVCSVLREQWQATRDAAAM